MAEQELRDHLDYIRTEIRQEVELLNGRLNALMSSQSFLVIAYASILASASGEFHSLYALSVPTLMALLGAALVVEALPSLGAAREAIKAWRSRESDLLKSTTGFGAYTLANDDRSRDRVARRQHQGVHFAMRAPTIMLVAWAIFAMLPFALAVFA